MLVVILGALEDRCDVPGIDCRNLSTVERVACGVGVCGGRRSVYPFLLYIRGGESSH